MATYLCEICKQPNAKFRQYSKITGLLVVSFSSHTKPVALCDNHKFKGSINANIHNLLFGWWGIRAFILNIIALIHNSMGGNDATLEVEKAYATHLSNSKEAVEKQKNLR